MISSRDLELLASGAGMNLQLGENKYCCFKIDGNKSFSLNKSLKQHRTPRLVQTYQNFLR